MKIHQVKWTFTKKEDLEFRLLSCFSCQNLCTHYYAVSMNYATSTFAEEEPVPEKSPPKVVRSKCKRSSSRKDVNEVDVQTREELMKKFDSSSLKEGDYVCVEFTMEQTGGVRRWLGEIMRVNENDTYLIRFLRSKEESKFHSGFLYYYPSKEDVDTVYKTKILYIVPPPTDFHRYKKFSIHFANL